MQIHLASYTHLLRMKELLRLVVISLAKWKLRHPMDSYRSELMEWKDSFNYFFLSRFMPFPWHIISVIFFFGCYCCFLYLIFLLLQGWSLLLSEIYRLNKLLFPLSICSVFFHVEGDVMHLLFSSLMWGSYREIWIKRVTRDCCKKDSMWIHRSFSYFTWNFYEHKWWHKY